MQVLRDALRQLPDFRPGTRPGRKILIRADAAGCTHATLAWLHAQRLSYSVGFPLPDNTADLVARIPISAWTPAYDSDGELRPGAWVAELTGLLDLTGWPPGMRVIVGKERPHPGAQLRLTDADGHRSPPSPPTAEPAGPARSCPTSSCGTAARARAEDRIRCAKDTGLTNLPLHAFTQNQIWCALVTLACDLLAWTQLLALAGHQARRWEPKRLRLLSAAGRMVTSGRRVTLHLARTGPWTQVLLDAFNRLRALPAPG